jgi:hypothetical protein
MGAPVVVLDRFQIFDELAVGCGRPTPQEIVGTKRIYLTARRVAEGELPAEDCYDLILEIVDSLSRDYRHLVLEGGSISLCALLFRRGLLGRHEVRVEQLVVDDERAYRRRVRARVVDMLTAKSDRPSMIEELSCVWDRPRELAFVETIAGYGAIMDHCRNAGENARALARKPPSDALVDAVTSSHLAYARDQRRVFRRLCGEGVTRRPAFEFESGTFPCMDRSELSSDAEPQPTPGRAALASNDAR